jgi:hypothetical protein
MPRGDIKKVIEACGRGTMIMAVTLVIGHNSDFIP